MNQYLLLKLEVQCGEYEFTSIGVHEIPMEVNINDFSEKYAKEFYRGSMELENERTYYFNNREVAVEVLERENISKEEYNVMKKYL